MEREQTTVSLPIEVKEFIKLIKSLNSKQQAGLNIMLEGLNLLAEKQKSGKLNR